MLPDTQLYSPGVPRLLEVGVPPPLPVVVLPHAEISKLINIATANTGAIRHLFNMSPPIQTLPSYEIVPSWLTNSLNAAISITFIPYHSFVNIALRIC